MGQRDMYEIGMMAQPPAITEYDRASFKRRDEMFPKAGHSSQRQVDHFPDFCHHMEKQMTKLTFASAVRIAATVFATQAMAARDDAAARHATIKDCVRAPNVGAIASDHYTVPPCLPNTAPNAIP